MFDWASISTDPACADADAKWLTWYDTVCTRWELNSPEGRDARIIKYLSSFAKSSHLRILDVGFVEHSVSRTTSPEWFHRKLRETSSFEVYGVDLLSKAVQEIQSKYGYPNCYCADATNADSDPIDGGQFDVIHAGDIIEHLSDMKGFFGFLRNNLRKGGGVVLTTPNPHSIFRILRLARFGGAVANFQHVAWITPTNMNELCRRYGFDFSHSIYSVHNELKSRILKTLPRVAFRYRDFYFDEFTYIIRLK